MIGLFKFARELFCYSLRHSRTLKGYFCHNSWTKGSVWMCIFACLCACPACHILNQSSVARIFFSTHPLIYHVRGRTPTHAPSSESNQINKYELRAKAAAQTLISIWFPVAAMLTKKKNYCKNNKRNSNNNERTYLTTVAHRFASSLLLLLPFVCVNVWFFSPRLRCGILH